MKYRAILKGVDPDAKPIQAFSNSKEDLRKWATDILASVSPKYKAGASVMITEQKWVIVESILA